jgi:tetratricopeptide (TPR) repeat protein
VLSLALAVWLYPRLSGHPRIEVATPERDAFNLYVLGGSTADGVPYDVAFDLGKLTAYLFGGEIGGRKIVVTTLARSGKETSEALEDAREISRFKHAPDTAAAILYSGDNEFLKYSARPNLMHSDRRLFDVPVVPSEKREQIMRDYDAHVREIGRLLHGAGVELIVCTGGINIGDREPNRSVLDDPKNEPRVSELLDRADARLAEGDRDGDRDAARNAALVELRSALALEPHFAWTHKRAGDVLRSLGRIDEARVEYQAAMDWDGAPLSFTTPINQTVRDVARELDLPLADLEPAFRAAAKDGLPGYDLFWDNCHPTLEGFLIMAKGIAGAIEKRYHVACPRKDPAPEAVAAAFKLDRAFTANFLIGRGSNMYGLALLTWNPKERLARSHLYLDRSAELVPDDPALMCTQAVLCLVEGDLETSRKWWKSAFALQPDMARKRVAFADVTTLLKKAGVDDPQSIFVR